MTSDPSSRDTVPSELERQAPEVADANEPPAISGEADPHVLGQNRPDLRSVRAVFFDLDDTLCGYWESSKAALRRAFELHRPEGHDVEAMVRHWAAAFREFAPNLKPLGWWDAYLKSGEPTRTEQMRRTLARLGVEDEVRAQALAKAYGEGRDRGLRLFPDALEVLDALKGRYRLGLMTNGPADVQRQEVATLGIGAYFDPILIEGELGEGKPHRSVFLRAQRHVGLEPEEILMVGNSYHHDIQAALEAGWHAIWIRRPTDVPPSANDDAKPEEKPEHGPEPDAVLGELKPLPAMLDLG